MMKGNVKRYDVRIKELLGYGILEAIGDGISIQDTDYRILYQNKAHKDFVGSHEGEYCYIAYELRDRTCEGCPLARTFKDGKTHKKIRSVSTQKGVSYFEITTLPIRGPDGRIIAGIEVARDITERKQYDDKLKSERRQLLSIFDSIDEIIYVSDPDTYEILFVNRALKDKFGDVAGRKCYMAFQGLDSPCPFCTNDKIFGENAGKSCIWEFRNRVNNRWYHCIDKAISWPDGRMVRCEVAIDITESKQADERLKHKDLYDQLTNLPNRTFFMKNILRVIERAKRHKNYLFAVIMIDLDRFKVINDSLGHLIGDRLLVMAAERLKVCIRPGDTIARFGGDEFAILLDDIKDAGDATGVADRAQKELNLPFDIGGHKIYSTASMGIALSAERYEGHEEIIRDADSAMYRAKALGKARYQIFDINMHSSAMNLLQLEVDLRHAVKGNEFLVYYQPVISLKSDRIIAAEALIRWDHPKRGLIPPAEFIPLAEETGLILTIGERILKSACARNRAWQDAGGRPLVMKVNFSACQFRHQNVVELIRRTLQETGMAAKYLDIEITESTAMEEHSILTLSELSDMGLQISIDDFGTGYSSLGALKSFPINTLKIDGSFVREIARDTNDEAIIKAIIAMAHNLSIKVIAEGVETEEQKAFLKTQQCDEMQGYLFKRPVSGREFAELQENEKLRGC